MKRIALIAAVAAVVAMAGSAWAGDSDLYLRDSPHSRQHGAGGGWRSQRSRLGQLPPWSTPSSTPGGDIPLTNGRGIGADVP